MKPYLTLPFIALAMVLTIDLHAQFFCSSSTPPTGLGSLYTPGSGVKLAWTPVTGSVGVQIKITTPSGANVTRRLAGSEIDQYFVPDALLVPGAYTFRVQAACTLTPPYNVTPVSVTKGFTIPDLTCPATVMDVDGNVYSTVAIGGQCWMAENLKTEHYQDGSAIPTGLSNSAWASTSSGACAEYNNFGNKGTYGLLYNWYAVDDARGICPAGWHVPSDAEWTTLTDGLGGVSVAGGPMKSTGTWTAGTGLWNAPNTGATNSSGFSGLPGGGRGDNGFYSLLRDYGWWWSATESSANFAWYRDLYFEAADVLRNDNNKKVGFSVRCIKD